MPLTHQSTRFTTLTHGFAEAQVGQVILDPAGCFATPVSPKGWDLHNQPGRVVTITLWHFGVSAKLHSPRITMSGPPGDGTYEFLSCLPDFEFVFHDEIKPDDLIFDIVTRHGTWQSQIGRVKHLDGLKNCSGLGVLNSFELDPEDGSLATHVVTTPSDILLRRKNSVVVPTNTHYPHQCWRCGSPSYNSGLGVDCSNKSCTKV